MSCRDSKVKCSGERPTCARCAQRLASCVYDAETNEPAWVQSIASNTSSALPSPDTSLSTQTQQIPRNAFSSAPTDLANVNCPPGLTWYAFSQHWPDSTNVVHIGCSHSNFPPERDYIPCSKPTSTMFSQSGCLRLSISRPSCGCWMRGSSQIRQAKLYCT